MSTKPRVPMKMQCVGSIVTLEQQKCLRDSDNKESPPTKIMLNHKRNYQNSSDNLIEMLLHFLFSAVFKGACCLRRHALLPTMLRILF